MHRNEAHMMNSKLQKCEPEAARTMALCRAGTYRAFMARLKTCTSQYQTAFITLPVTLAA